MKLLKVLGSMTLTCGALVLSGCATYHNLDYASDYSINRHVKDSLTHGPGYDFPNVTGRRKFSSVKCFSILN